MVQLLCGLRFSVPKGNTRPFGIGQGLGEKRQLIRQRGAAEFEIRPRRRLPDILRYFRHLRHTRHFSFTLKLYYNWYTEIGQRCLGHARFGADCRSVAISHHYSLLRHGSWGITSQWPPLSGPMRRMRPDSLRVFRFFFDRSYC